jgi:hypothetical protein
MDNDATIKPQVGIDIAEAIDNIVALCKYLEATSVCLLTENLLDLRDEKGQN